VVVFDVDVVVVFDVDVVVVVDVDVVVAVDVDVDVAVRQTVAVVGNNVLEVPDTVAVVGNNVLEVPDTVAAADVVGMEVCCWRNSVQNVVDHVDNFFVLLASLSVRKKVSFLFNLKLFR